MNSEIMKDYMYIEPDFAVNVAFVARMVLDEICRKERNILSEAEIMDSWHYETNGADNDERFLQAWYTITGDITGHPLKFKFDTGDLTTSGKVFEIEKVVITVCGKNYSAIKFKRILGVPQAVGNDIKKFKSDMLQNLNTF